MQRQQANVTGESKWQREKTKRNDKAIRQGKRKRQQANGRSKAKG